MRLCYVVDTLAEIVPWPVWVLGYLVSLTLWGAILGPLWTLTTLMGTGIIILGVATYVLIRDLRALRAPLRPAPESDDAKVVPSPMGRQTGSESPGDDH